MGASLSKPSHARASTTPSSLAKDSRHHYFDPRQEACRIVGDGAEILGIEGFITKLEWQNLCEGFSRDGSEKYVQNAGDPNRQAFVTLTLYPPKAFSVLYAVSRPEMKSELMAVDDMAIYQALGRTAEVVGYTRRGEGNGEAYERAALVWGLFRHYSSQTNDPHIHTHASLLNLGVRQDGTTGSIRNLELFGDIKAINAVYEAELSHGLKKLGFTVTSHPKQGFTIKEVPEELCRKFSSRSDQIKSEMERRGAKNPKALSYAAKSTRPNKEIHSHDALVFSWQKKIRAWGFDAKKISTPGNEETNRQKVDLNKVIVDSIKTSPKKVRNHHIEVVRKVAIERGADGQAVKEAFRNHLPQGIVNVKWKQVFKKAPAWSPATLIKAPVLVLGNPKEFKRWGDIKFERKTALGHFRIQERFLFPNAPRISPIHNLKLPALRFGKMRLREFEKWDKVKWKKNLGIGELRVQQRKLFPRALPWNPVKDLKAPAIRFVPKQKKQISDRQQQQSY